VTSIFAAITGELVQLESTTKVSWKLLEQLSEDKLIQMYSGSMQLALTL
jgi:hypothetical protein